MIIWMRRALYSPQRDRHSCFDLQSDPVLDDQWGGICSHRVDQNIQAHRLPLVLSELRHHLGIEVAFLEC